MFTPEDIADYYNTTQNHYERWWDLKNGLSLHYGIWEPGIRNFTESVINTNRTLMNLAEVKESDRVLDAGCGVGGAAMLMASQQNATVTGITLSTKQVEYATKTAAERGLSDRVNFRVMNYTDTDYPDETFDVVWACESMSSATNKYDFIKEAYRVLKKGGRLVMSDCFITDEGQHDPNEWIRKWGETWGVENHISGHKFSQGCTDQGFEMKYFEEFTEQVRKSAKRMYYASLLGTLPSELYNLTHPKVSRFAKHHYRSGYYQYKALQKDLWRYYVLLAVK